MTRSEFNQRVAAFCDNKQSEIANLLHQELAGKLMDLGLLREVAQTLDEDDVKEFISLLTEAARMNQAEADALEAYWSHRPGLN